MPQTPQDALKSAKFILHEDTYSLIRLHPRAITVAAGVIAEIGEPICALIVDPYEVTLVIPQEAAEDFSARLHQHEKSQDTYRVIMVDAQLAPDLVGFMAVMSTALANANIPVFPYAAYTRDHIMVPATQAEAALATLKALQANLNA